MECQCEKDDYDNASGWWLGSNPVQMGAFSVVGYLLYRFSQTLPALIRWPIRFFCSITGLSALWSWVGRLVGTLRSLQSLFKWLSRVWRFIQACLSKFKAVTGLFKDGAEETSILHLSGSSRPSKPGLRLILLGPAGGGRTSLADTLLGDPETRTGADPVKESTNRRAVVDGGEVTVVDTPDLLASSLGSNKKAREALRSLQLVSPGPHAVLMVIRAPGSNVGVDQDATQAVKAVVELFGDEVLGHIIPVFTHADGLGRKQTVDQLLDADTRGDLRKAVSLCGQRPELVDNRPDSSPQARSVVRRQLAGRVMELKELRGHLVHELQRREDRMREEVLTDMASALARKLGHM